MYETIIITVAAIGAIGFAVIMFMAEFNRGKC